MPIVKNKDISTLHGGILTINKEIKYSLYRGIPSGGVDGIKPSPEEKNL